MVGRILGSHRPGAQESKDAPARKVKKASPGESPSLTLVRGVSRDPSETLDTILDFSSWGSF